MAQQEVKAINGHRYLYLTYYDQDTKSKKTFYCGKENEKESKSKAIQKEIELIDMVIKEHIQKKQSLMKGLN